MLRNVQRGMVITAQMLLAVRLLCECKVKFEVELIKFGGTYLRLLC